MTAKTNGQVFVDSDDEMINYFIGSDFIDCRINGYPLHHQNESMKLYPSFIFIDLDLSLCSSCKYPIRKLDYLLKQTLKKAKEEINGHPTVLWTGGGYHIYQPVKIVTKYEERLPLENFKEFEDFKSIVRSNLTTEFIRYAGRYFTNNKGDPKHNPSIYSCLVRVPGTTNSKYGNKVKVIQEWDGVEAIASPLLVPFLNHLIQTKIEDDELKKRTTIFNPRDDHNQIAWIEKLLVTPIPDHRYYCLWHILIPYLVNVKGLSQDEVISIITQWLDECDKLCKIRWKYPQRIKEQLKYDKGFPPIGLENLQKENIELYKLLQN